VVLEKYKKKIIQADNYKEKERLDAVQRMMEKREKVQEKQARISDFQSTKLDENEIERKYLTKVKDQME